VIATATSVYAQQPQAIRGTIDKIDGGIVSIKQANGADVDVKLLDNAKVFGVQAATIADVKPNDFIGVGAMPQPDGSQKAIQVTIFAESQRGTGEGFGPWDRPGATMTNGTAENTVASVNGQVVMVKYKGGEQKIIIGPDAYYLLSGITKCLTLKSDATSVNSKITDFHPNPAFERTQARPRRWAGLCSSDT
jgi:hypothetical protein